MATHCSGKFTWKLFKLRDELGSFGYVALDNKTTVGHFTSYTTVRAWEIIKRPSYSRDVKQIVKHVVIRA